MKRILFLCTVLLSLVPSMAATYDIPSTNRIDWSTAGRVGGVPTITTIYTTEAPTVSITTLNSDIVAASTQYRSDGITRAIILPTNYYSFPSGVLLYSGVVLRGGSLNPNETKLTFAGYPGVEFKNNRSSDSGPGGLGTTITGNYNQGATSVVVASASGLSVGQFVKIYEAYDTNYIKEEKFIGDAVIEGGPGTNSVVQWVKITSLSGTTLGFTPSLRWYYGSPFNPQVVGPVSASYGGASFCQNSGLENLTVDNSSTASSSQENLFGQYVANCWVHNVISTNGYGKHLEAWDWVHNTIQHSVFTHLLNQATDLTSSRGYGVNFGTPNSDPHPPSACEDNLVYDNAFDQQRTSLLVGYSSEGNVITLNLFTNALDTASTYERTEVLVHSGFTRFNLFELNYGDKFGADMFHGGSALDTVFRNHWKGRSNPAHTSSIYALEIAAWHHNYNIIANVLGVSGQSGYTGGQIYSASPPGLHYTSNNEFVGIILGYDSENGGETYYDGGGIGQNAILTLLSHGNFDFATSTQHLISGELTTFPASLYWAANPLPSGYPWPSMTLPSENGTAAPVIGHIPVTVWYPAQKYWDQGAAIAGGGGGTTGGGTTGGGGGSTGAFSVSATGNVIMSGSIKLQ